MYCKFGLLYNLKIPNGVFTRAAESRNYLIIDVHGLDFGVQRITKNNTASAELLSYTAALVTQIDGLSCYCYVQYL